MKTKMFFLLFSFILLLNLEAMAQDSLSYLVIRSSPDGGGSEVTSVTMIADQSLTLYAAGYDTSNNFIGDQTAKWTTTGNLDKMEDDSTNIFIFSPLKCRPSSAGTIIATVGEFSDTTGIINVMGCGLCNIIIRDAPGGGGNEVNDTTLTTDQEFILYAAGYDESDNYMYDLTAKWTTTGTLDRMEEDSTNIFTFSPVTAPTSGSIRATAGNIMDGTGTISVSLGKLCYTKIWATPCDSSIVTLNPPSDMVCFPEYEDTTTAYVGDHLDLLAAGYDCSNNFITTIAITFDSTVAEFTGTLQCEVPSGTDFSLKLTFTEAGQGRVILNGTDTSGVIIVTENPLGLMSNETIPSEYRLEQAYPNPFNPSTTIKYNLAKAEHVTIEVYNNIGQKVEILVDHNMSAGEHKVEFNAMYLSSGVYYYRLVTANFADVKKIILMK